MKAGRRKGAGGRRSRTQSLRRLLKLLGRLSPARLVRWIRRRAGLSWREPTEVRLPHAILWVDAADESLGRALLGRGEYEPGWSEWLRAAVTPGARVVDVGANIGYYSVLLGQLVGPGGRVLALEPEPHNFALLERNLAANRLSNVEALQAAASDAPGRVALHLNERHHGVHSLGAGNCSYRGGRARIEVEALRLDDVLEERGMAGEVSFAKIDAQGAEALILRGAPRLLAQETLAILLEVWPAGLLGCGTSLEDLLEILEGAGLAPSFLSKAPQKAGRGEASGGPPAALRPVPWAKVREKGSRSAAARHSSFNVLLRKAAAGS